LAAALRQRLRYRSRTGRRSNPQVRRGRGQLGTERGRTPRSEIREERWKEVKKEAFIHVAYERNAKRLLAELDSRDAAAAMRAYADEIDAHTAELEDADAQAAREWAKLDPPACRAHRPTERAIATG
jgi:hypothetical protein